jgi:rRNA-processing protein FCF1
MMGVRLSLGPLKSIILDTNFLVYVLEFKIDLFAELDRVIPSGYKAKILDKTINELEKLSVKNVYAKIALGLLDKFEVIKTSGDDVDDMLVEMQGNNVIIGTQDRELKNRLECSKLIIRQKKYLALV